MKAFFLIVLSLALAAGLIASLPYYLFHVRKTWDAYLHPDPGQEYGRIVNQAAGQLARRAESDYDNTRVGSDEELMRAGEAALRRMRAAKDWEYVMKRQPLHPEAAPIAGVPLLFPTNIKPQSPPPPPPPPYIESKLKEYPLDLGGAAILSCTEAAPSISTEKVVFRLINETDDDFDVWQPLGQGRFSKIDKVYSANHAGISYVHITANKHDSMLIYRNGVCKGGFQVHTDDIIRVKWIQQ